ncbi:hypothetical protein GCM10010341_89260 [Streptomyces noursei]|nr:hypothetical protein GCM10010341_89260 [Streptomyces noursei]
MGRGALCLGTALARLEARTDLTELPMCHPKMVGKPVPQHGVGVRGRKELPVKWAVPPSVHTLQTAQEVTRV